MKRKILMVIFCVAAITAVGAMTACNKPHEHTWNNGEVTKPATCSATGLMTYTCTGCNETKTERIDKTDHPHTDGWLYNDEEHWQTVTCEHTGERASVGTHVWDNVEVLAEANCLKTGLKKYTCVCGKTKTEITNKTDHSYSKTWITDNEKHWRACQTEGCNEITDEHAHNWDKGEITTPATCLTQGVKTYTCTDCDKTRTEALNIIGHDYNLSAWAADEINHFHACTTKGCTAKTDEQPHTFGDWTQKGQMVKVCEDCEYEATAPHIAGNSGSKTLTVGNGETAGLTLFTMSKGYYTVHCTTTVEVTFTCNYYDRLGEYHSEEFTLSSANNTFTVKLEERSSGFITAVSSSVQTTEISVYVTYDDKAPSHTHHFSEEWSYDGNFHWHACTGTGCDEDADAAVHDFENGACKDCGYSALNN